MARAVNIPVTVKMRAGWDEHEINAPDLARRMEDAGAAAITVHGRTAAQSLLRSRRTGTWSIGWRGRSAIPVFGSGDCVEPDAAGRSGSATAACQGVLVGRGVLRNPWIFAQAAALARGEAPREVSQEERGRFLLEYIDLLLNERTGEAAGFRHVAPTSGDGIRERDVARGHDRWVINKLRALNSWYTKGSTTAHTCGWR